MDDKEPRPFRTYKVDEIQKVYARHHQHCGTVLYSTDGGVTWQTEARRAT